MYLFNFFYKLVFHLDFFKLMLAQNAEILETDSSMSRIRLCGYNHLFSICIVIVIIVIIIANCAFVIRFIL